MNSYKIEKAIVVNGLRGCVVQIDLRLPSMPPHRCGYVEVPPVHPLHGVEYYQRCAALNGRTPNQVVEVHGGVTFSGVPNFAIGCKGWWFGFDCAHYGDTLETCTLKYVLNECRKMAVRLKYISLLAGGDDDPSN